MRGSAHDKAYGILRKHIPPTDEISFDDLADDIANVIAGWRPIETAPKTGARVILGWDDSAALPMHCEMGRFKHGTARDSGWCNTYGHPFSGSPTHWMPLPEPPSNKSLK